MSTMAQLLAAIERDNERRFKSSSRRSLYKGGSAPAPNESIHKVVNPKTSKQQASDDHRSHGVFGTLKNLANDVEDTVRGIPGGVIAIAHDPVGGAKAIGGDYKRRYGPLFGYVKGEGDIGKFASEMQQHPLAPLLDAASLATGGGALAAKVGQSAKVAKAVERAQAAATVTRDTKAAAKAAEITAPAKASVATLTKRVGSVKVDRDAAASRAAGVPSETRVAQAVKPFHQKITKLEKQRGAEEAQLVKVEQLSKRPGSSLKTKAKHQDQALVHDANIAAIDNAIKSVVKDMRAAKKTAKEVDPHIVKSAERSLAKHESTISQLQSQIIEHSKTVAKAEAKLAKKTAKPAEITATLPRMLVRLQNATGGGYRMIGADKAGEFKGIPVALHRNPVKRLRQNLGIDLQESKLIPQRTPLIGLESRAKKAANLTRDVEAGRTRATQRNMIRAADALEKVAKGDTQKASAMAVAAQALIDGVSPADYARLVRDTRSTADEIQHSIRNKVSQKDHHKLTEELIRPHLDPKAQELYLAAKQHFQKEALDQGREVNPMHLQHKFSSKLINSPEVRAIVALQKAHEKVAEHALEQLVKNRMLKPDVASKQAVLHLNLARAARGLKQWTPEEAAKHFEEAGLPAPSYNPDTLTIGDAGKREGMLKESKGKLYSRGTRRNDPMNIVLRHELASKATDLSMAHKLMLSAARKIPAGDKLPKGYIWIKDTVAPQLETKEALFKNQVHDGVALGDDYFKLLETEKRPTGGFAIRKDVADDLMAGRKAMTAARNETMTKVVSAWKYLVLFRPAFVVHNLVGNQLMFHLKNGWNFAAMHNARKALGSGAFDEHHFAEGLTFSEDVMGKGTSKISKAANVFYKVTAQHEHWLRQLTMYETARKMPQVQREMARLKGGKWTSKDGKTMFHEAYNEAVRKHPHIRDLVTRNMDDTLGNYRYYTAQERMLKNISPFYGWERHSVRNMVRMMEDNPATMAMLTQIGMIGHDKFNKDFGPGMPDFVKTYVQDSYIQTIAQHLGLGEHVSMYDFNSVNPWTTAVQVGQAATGNRDAQLGLAGPIITGPAEAISGKNPVTGAPSESRFDDPFLGTLDRVITSTPPVQTFDALTSDKNENKKLLKTSDWGMMVRQGGGDFRDLDKDRARKMNADKHVKRDKYGNPIKKRRPKPHLYNN